MAEVRRWLSHIVAERRMSPKTAEAYERDVRQFLGFLTEHAGALITLTSLAALEPRDVRAFMASRRSDGIGSRSLMRSLAGARSFARFLERNGKGKVGALSGRSRSQTAEDTAEANCGGLRQATHRHGPARRRGARAVGDRA